MELLTSWIRGIEGFVTLAAVIPALAISVVSFVRTLFALRAKHRAARAVKLRSHIDGAESQILKLVESNDLGDYERVKILLERYTDQLSRYERNIVNEGLSQNNHEGRHRFARELASLTVSGSAVGGR